MSREKSLVCAYLLDGNGGGREISLAQVEQWSPDDGILWVHLNYHVKSTERWLKKHTKLHKLIINALIADESRPRSLVRHDGLLVTLRGVNLNPGQDPEDMISLRLWLNANIIITTRRRQLLSIEALREAISENLGPRSTGEYLTMICDLMSQRTTTVVEGIEDDVDALENDVLTQESYQLRPRISESRRETILIRRYLAPQREALAKLYQEETPWLSAENRAFMREIHDRIIRQIEELDTARYRAGVIHEELSARIAERMDSRVYLLSLVALIFLPLTFITGLLGINVGGIPAANNPLGFWWVSILLVAITGGMIYLLRRNDWM